MLISLRLIPRRYGILCLVGLTLGLGYFLTTRHNNALRKSKEHTEITGSQRTQTGAGSREHQARYREVKELLQLVSQQKLKVIILDQMARDAKTLAEIEEVVALAKKHLGTITPKIAGKWAEFDMTAAVADTEMCDDRTEREARFLDIIKTVAKADFEQAMVLLDKLEATETRDLARHELALAIALNDPDRAIKLVQKIADRGRSDAGLEKIALLQVSHNATLALATVNSMQSLGRKENSLSKLIGMIGAHDPKKALEMIQASQEDLYLTDVYAPIICNLMKSDLQGATSFFKETMGAMKGYEIGDVLKNAYRNDQTKGIQLLDIALRESTFPQSLISQMAPTLLSDDFETGLKYLNLIPNTESRAEVLDELIYNHTNDLPFETFKIFYDQLQESSYNEDRAKLLQLAQFKKLLEQDPKIAMEKVANFSDPFTRDRLYVEIGEFSLNSDPNITLQAIQRIESASFQEYRIAQMIKTYLGGTE